ncbi:hypothetical protein BIU96_02990 [Curtobacterium sp. MCBA15_008]|nr:hypothetical protein BIU96_02990 [Curtobacterium sp. MCBA15_008]
MGRHRLQADRQVVAREHQLLGPRSLCRAGEPLDEQAGGRRCDRRDPVRRERCHRSAPDLRGDRRPRGVVVGTCVLDALQAGARAGDDERADADPAVPDDDRQVRHAPPRPRRTERRVDDVVGDDDGQPRFLFGQDHRAAVRSPGAGDGHALAGEELRQRVRQRAGAVHLDTGEGFRQHVDDGRGRCAEDAGGDLRRAPGRRGDTGQGITAGLTAQRAQEPFLTGRRDGHDGARRVDPELDGGRVAPDELERRIDADAHAPTLADRAVAWGAGRRSVENR